MIFNGAATRLADSDLPRIGHGIGVGEDELHAFLEVETSGGGFDDHGRPKMLFEPHRFYANLSGAKRALAVKGGLAYAAWGARPYPADSYPRLIAALAIDETAALASASWGIGQVMGANYVAAGYASPQAMVAAFLDSEAEQLEAAVRFIKHEHLDDELRAHQWAAFARGYNGAQYAKNAYDAKLSAAFKKWAAIRDTPWSPEPAVTLALAVAATPENPVIVKACPHLGRDLRHVRQAAGGVNRHGPGATPAASSLPRVRTCRPPHGSCNGVEPLSGSRVVSLRVCFPRFRDGSRLAHPRPGGNPGL